MFILTHGPEESRIKQFCKLHMFGLAIAASSQTAAISLGALTTNHYFMPNQPLHIQDAAAKVATTSLCMTIAIGAWAMLKARMLNLITYASAPVSIRFFTNHSACEPTKMAHSYKSQLFSKYIQSAY